MTRPPPIFRETAATTAAERALLRWLQRALPRALAGSLALTSGCAASSARAPTLREPENEAPPTEPACETYRDWKLSGINPAVAYEHISVRRAAPARPRSYDTHGPPARHERVIETLSQVGHSCGHPLGAACQEQLQAVRDATGDDPGPWLVAISNGAVRVFRLDQLRELFGPIDTGTEAHWLVARSGYSVEGCMSENTRPTANGVEVRAYKGGDGCGPDNVMRRTDFVLEVHADGTIATLSEHSYAEQCPPMEPIIGRRPAGLASHDLGAETRSPGAHFAQAAAQEAVSIAAFLQLHGELARAGAPAALLHGALRSAHDELRHARTMGTLARAFGAAPERAVVHARPPRSLFYLALDNAVEGCIHETFSAARIAFQAARCQPALRAPLASIARDELRHAAWSWRLARWAEPRLPRAQRALVAHARRDALERMHAGLTEPAAELQRVVGLPDLTAARSLAAGLHELTGA